MNHKVALPSSVFGFRAKPTAAIGGALAGDPYRKHQGRRVPVVPPARGSTKGRCSGRDLPAPREFRRART